LSEKPCAVEGCAAAVGRKGARGWCSRHYQRWLKSGSPLGTTRPTAEARFFAKVRQVGDCWLWTASQDQSGYGLFSGRPGGASIRSHIWAYEHLIGERPPGLELDHLCRNRACVNPYHLDPVPGYINWLRGEAPSRINRAKSQCKRGHEFTEQNTYIQRNGSRRCETCMADHRRAYEIRKKAA